MRKNPLNQALEQWRGYRPRENEKTPRSFSEIISAALGKIGLAQRFRESAIQDQWEQIVGEFVAAHTRAAGLQRNVLTVEVDHSMWLQELSLLHKQVMLEKLREQLPELKIRDLKFRLRG